MVTQSLFHTTLDPSGSQTQTHTDTNPRLFLGNLFSGSAGRIDLQPEARAFDTQSFSWIASMSKLITTTAVMQLVDRGTLGLDEDVRRFVPELATVQVLRNFKNGLPVLEDNTKPITLRYFLLPAFLSLSLYVSLRYLY